MFDIQVLAGGKVQMKGRLDAAESAIAPNFA